MNRQFMRAAVWCLVVLLSLSSQASSSVSAAPDLFAHPNQGARPSSVGEAPAVDTDIAWPMAGATPQRTSWTQEQVPTAAYLAAHRNEAGNGMLYPQ